MNIPNKLSLLRIFMIIAFLILFFIKAIPFNYLFSAVIFALAALTDFLDGFIARKYNLVTSLGKFLDPIADKLLVSSALIVMLTNQAVMPPVWCALGVTVIIGRELLISAFRQIAVTKGIIMSADMFGKIKTVFQDFAIIVLLIAFEFECASAGEIIRIIGLSLLGIAVALTIASAVNYLIKNRSVLKDE